LYLSAKNIDMEIKPIAHFRSPFTSKFGIPKQSGLVEELRGEIVFESNYRDPAALHGLEDFDYIWLIWGFSANEHEAFSPTVRPPLLGGNVRMGVFATRSPFRPNPIGMSSVRIVSINIDTEQGPVITVSGADLMDGTPIYDINHTLRSLTAIQEFEADSLTGIIFIDLTSSFHHNLLRILTTPN
jgi:tRNA-Thr(GGU) m(6)t(6)A37 methyltransferase TsaA